MKLDFPTFGKLINNKKLKRNWDRSINEMQLSNIKQVVIEMLQKPKNNTGQGFKLYWSFSKEKKDIYNSISNPYKLL